MTKFKDMNRFKYNGSKTIASEDGLIFKCRNTCINFYKSDFKILGSYIDTVRQMYKGAVNHEALGGILDTISDNEKIISFLGCSWVVGKMFKGSGYQYKLQNNDIGITVLYKNYFSKETTPATHLKIECSPWFLDNRSPEQVQEYLDSIADHLLFGYSYNYCHIHLAVDVQGWEPDLDLCHRIKCRSRRTAQHDGANILEFDWDQINGVYDRAQSFRLGSASGLQMAVYDKTYQSKCIDKLDYMRDKWVKSNRNYDQDKTVFRVELRYHKDVIEQFSNGSFNKLTGAVGLSLVSFVDIVKHLKALWVYGLPPVSALLSPLLNLKLNQGAVSE